MKRFALAGALAVALSVATLPGQPVEGTHRARQLLQRAIKSAHSLRYTGRRVLEFRRGPDTERHEEYVIRDGRNTRVEFPPGSRLAGQVIVENEHERRHYLPQQNEIHVLPPRFREGVKRLARLMGGHRGRRYVLGSGAGETVAGVRAEQVTVADRHGNVVQRLYIDPASGLVLKRRLFDPVGTQVGYSAFTQVDLTPRIPRDAFRIVRRGARIVTPLDMLRRLAREGGFEAVHLPPQAGYRLESAAVRRVPSGRALTQSYQGPRGRLTLFQLATEVDPQRLKRHARERVRAYSWKRNGRTLVLLGDLDEAGLQALAARVRELR